MAELHNALRRGLITEALKKAVGDTRAAGGVERFGETLDPIIDLWGQPEFAILRNEFLWSVSDFQAAVVAELSAYAVVNPIGSRQVIIIEHVSVAPGSATQVVAVLATRATIAATLGAGTVAPALRDNRPTGEALGTATRAVQIETFEGSDPALIITGTGTLETVICPTSPTTSLTMLPVIIKPGSGYVLQCSTVNINLTVNLAGRVRVALPSELFPQGQ